MKRTTHILALTVGCVLVGTSALVAGGGLKLQVKPWTWVGTVANDGVAGTPTAVTAAWLPGIGVTDHGLLLQKAAPTADWSAAGATIEGVAGIKLQKIGFDVQSGGHCGAGAPRFNVVTDDNVTHFIGCSSPAPVSNDTITDARGQTWERRAYDPAQAYPPIDANATVKSINIVFDEGTDVGQGFVVLDNITINDVVVGKPGAAF